jgi:hypothetical protein
MEADLGLFLVEDLVIKKVGYVSNKKRGWGRVKKLKLKKLDRRTWRLLSAGLPIFFLMLFISTLVVWYVDSKGLCLINNDAGTALVVIIYGGILVSASISNTIRNELFLNNFF